MERICRKCREIKNLTDLTKNVLDGLWYCKDTENCNWHKKDRYNSRQTAASEDDEFNAIMDAFQDNSIAENYDEIQKLQKQLAETSAQLAQLTNAKPELAKKADKNKGVYIITSAVSGALVNKPFLRALETYAEYRDAELRVVPLEYSIKGEEDDYIDESVTPYLTYQNEQLNANLLALGTIRVLPTAARPLSGFESFGKENSIILAHPKVEMFLVANPKGKLPKLLVTTGAITERRYSDSKAGQKAEFHHSLSALLVEVKNDEIFHVRHLHFDGKGFQDLNCYVDGNGEIDENARIEAIVQGDTHVGFTDPDVLNATFFNKNSLVRKLKPKYVVWHDMMDFYSRNHHHGVFEQIAKHNSQRNSIKDELGSIVDLLNKVNGCHKAEHILVGSNHNDAFSRWIKEADWKQDPVNAEIYLETALEIVRSARVGVGGAEYRGAFELWMNKLIPASISYRVLGRSESFTVKGIELGFHGDKGAGGARGSALSFAKSGSKYIIGHSHTPRIVDGCYQTGTSTRLNLEYTSGTLSSWLNSHVIIYPSGKRTHVNIIFGEYTTF